MIPWVILTMVKGVFYHSFLPHEVQAKLFSDQEFDQKKTSKSSSQASRKSSSRMRKSASPPCKLQVEVPLPKSPNEAVHASIAFPDVRNNQSLDVEKLPRSGPKKRISCSQLLENEDTFFAEEKLRDHVDVLIDLTEGNSDNFRPFRESSDIKIIEHLKQQDKVNCYPVDSHSCRYANEKIERERACNSRKPRKLLEMSAVISSAMLLDCIQTRRASIIRPSQFTCSP